MANDVIVPYFDTDPLPDNLPPGEDWALYIGDPAAVHVYLGTVAQLRRVLNPPDLFGAAIPTDAGRGGQRYWRSRPDAPLVDLYICEGGQWVAKLLGLVLDQGLASGLPTPAAPNFADFSDTQAGGSVRLVPTTGVPMTDYRYKVGADGNYQAVPPDGIITVGNVSAAIYAFSVPTALRNQSLTSRSTAFTAYNPTTPGTTQPAPPTFTNFQDTQVGGLVQLVPAAGLAFSDYQVKILGTGTYTQCPDDGVITVGNIDGQVFAYSVASGNRLASGTAASPVFTSYTPPTSGTTTPAAPTFADFNDTQAGGSVRLVPATGVSFADYRYKVGATGTYQVAPFDGVITVGNIDGAVYAYSVASGTRNQSQVGTSATFASYSGDGGGMAPTLSSIAITGPASVNEGNSATYGVLGTYSDGSTAAIASGISWGNNTPGGVLNVPSNNVVGDSTTVTVTASVGGKSASKTVNVVDTTAPPSGVTAYYGPFNSKTPAASDVLAQPTAQWSKAAVTITIPSNGQYPGFAEPQSQGTRSKISDDNGFDVTDSFTRSAITLNSVAYWLYIINRAQISSITLTLAALP